MQKKYYGFLLCLLLYGDRANSKKKSTPTPKATHTYEKVAVCSADAIRRDSKHGALFHLAGYFSYLAFSLGDTDSGKALPPSHQKAPYFDYISMALRPLLANVIAGMLQRALQRHIQWIGRHPALSQHLLFLLTGILLFLLPWFIGIEKSWATAKWASIAYLCNALITCLLIALLAEKK